MAYYLLSEGRTHEIICACRRGQGSSSMPRWMQRGHDREAYLETIDDSPTYDPRRGNLEQRR